MVCGGELEKDSARFLALAAEPCGASRPQISTPTGKGPVVAAVRNRTLETRLTSVRGSRCYSKSYLTSIALRLCDTYL